MRRDSADNKRSEHSVYLERSRLMGGELRGPLPIKVDASSTASFAQCQWPSTWRVPTVKPSFRLEKMPSASELNAGHSYNRSAVRATTLLTLNEAFAALGNIGGLFRLPKDSAFETAAAAEALAGDAQEVAAMPATGARESAAQCRLSGSRVKQYVAQLRREQSLLHHFHQGEFRRGGN